MSAVHTPTHQVGIILLLLELYKLMQLFYKIGNKSTYHPLRAVIRLISVFADIQGSNIGIKICTALKQFNIFLYTTLHNAHTGTHTHILGRSIR